MLLSMETGKKIVDSAAVQQAVAEAEMIIRGSLSKDVQSKIIRDYMEKVV